MRGVLPPDVNDESSAYAYFGIENGNTIGAIAV